VAGCAGSGSPSDRKLAEQKAARALARSAGSTEMTASGGRAVSG